MLCGNCELVSQTCQVCFPVRNDINIYINIYKSDIWNNNNKIRY